MGTINHCPERLEVRQERGEQGWGWRSCGDRETVPGQELVTPDQHGLGGRMATSVHLQKMHMVGLLSRNRSVSAPSLAVSYIRAPLQSKGQEQRQRGENLSSLLEVPLAFSGD